MPRRKRAPRPPKLTVEEQRNRQRRGAKRKGTRRENVVRDWYEKRGALVVLRSAASLGYFDLTAIFPDRVAFIQCKSPSSVMSRPARIRLIEQLPVLPGVEYVLATCDGENVTIEPLDPGPATKRGQKEAVPYSNVGLARKIRALGA